MLKMPWALSCNWSPRPIAVEVAVGLHRGVGVGVGVLVGFTVGETVGVMVGTGVPVGGGPKQTVKPSKVVGVAVGVVPLLPPPQLRSIADPRKPRTGANTSNRRHQSIAH